VKSEGGKVYAELPPPELLDPIMATEIGCKLATHCNGHANGAVVCSAAGA
jgi:hypothetical protein